MALSLFFLFLLLLLGSFCFTTVLAAARAHSDPLVIQLHRRHVPSDTTGIPLDHLKEILRSDQLRQQMFRGRLKQHRRRAYDIGSSTANESFRMPLRSAAYARTGQYFVRLLLGTPAQKFQLIVDTGSDLTWVKCRMQSEEFAQVHAFSPNSSSSFKPISCSSEICVNTLPFALAKCPSPASPCAYDFGYLGGAVAHGVFANESARVRLASGSRKKLRGLVVGCTSSATASSFETADGVLGLGHSEFSFAARATTQFGGLFSYCLVDHLSPRNVSSFLSFGVAAGTAEEELRETPLVLEPYLGPFYYVTIKGISVDGKLLPIPASVWDVKADGGAIVDSGTTLMMLVEPAYQAVTMALSQRLAKVPRTRLDPLDPLDPLEYCYNWTKWEQGDSPMPKLPVMAMHFSGGARFEPPAKSYVIDAAEGVKCLGITSLPSPGVSTIGNIMQQEHLWEFDVTNRRLRFGRSTCRVK